MTKKNAARKARKLRRKTIMGQLRTLRSRAVRKGTIPAPPAL
jgi:hypothetical protein